jgi:signal transduction histidine kinase
MSSLRRRLLLWLLPTALLCGVLASAATYWGALSELDELLNDQLQAIARHVEVDDNGRLTLADLRGEHRLSGEQPHGVLLQVWRGNAAVFSSDPDARLPPPKVPGLLDLKVDGRVWHTFVTSSGDTLIRVAQVRRARLEAVAEIAVHLFWPVLSLIPVLAVCLWFGVGYGLRPLRQLAWGLQQRDANNMDSIDTASMPVEVKPLVEALNGLLERLDKAFTVQRHFIADAAHELRTPIMGLGIQAGLLPQALNDRERNEIAAQIQAGTTCLAHLAEQLLTLARLAPDSRAIVMKEVNLSELARSVVAERARLSANHHIDLGLVVGTAVIRVMGDGDCLRILLNNLVDNAIRYAGARATIDVIVREEVAAGGKCAILEVSDTGPGIAEAEISRVWERFYRGSARAAPGSGLGLSIVKQIAEQHDAAVTLESGPRGRGLTVRLQFPATQTIR